MRLWAKKRNTYMNFSKFTYLVTGGGPKLDPVFLSPKVVLLSLASSIKIYIKPEVIRTFRVLRDRKRESLF
jgi:hypothetical protein